MSLHLFEDQEICMKEELERERIVLWSPKERKERVKNHYDYAALLHVWGEESMDRSQIKHYIMDVEDMEKYGCVISEWDVENTKFLYKEEGI